MADVVACGRLELRRPFTSSRQPEQLRDLLKLVVDPVTRAWLQSQLQTRIRSRLARLNPDLIGLALLAQARRTLFPTDSTDFV